MKSTQNATTNPVESNSRSRIRNLKKPRRKLKARIRLLKEDLTKSEELAFKYLGKLGDDQQKVKELLVEKFEVRDIVMNASHQNLAY